MLVKFPDVIAKAILSYSLDIWGGNTKDLASPEFNMLGLLSLEVSFDSVVM